MNIALPWQPPINCTKKILGDITKLNVRVCFGGGEEFRVLHPDFYIKASPALMNQRHFSVGGWEIQLSGSVAFQKKFTRTVTPHHCQSQCLVSCANLSRRWSSARTPCPGSLQTLPCAYAPYGSSADANFPPSARALYLHTEARSPLDGDRHPSPCRSGEISNVNLQPAGVVSDPQPPC